MNGADDIRSGFFYCGRCMIVIDPVDRTAHRGKGHYVSIVSRPTKLVNCTVKGCRAVVRIAVREYDFEGNGEPTDAFVRRMRNAVRFHLKTRHGNLSMKEHEAEMKNMLGKYYEETKVYTPEELKRLQW